MASPKFCLLIFLLAVAASLPTRAFADRNMLATEASPYLQSHAKDPVHWRPWGQPALDEAKRRGKPILLSIGYLACHWCHVMQEESFESPETAALINRMFLPVILDREERPDVDAAFQNQAFQLGLPTGWPLTLFLTPEGHPFFGGTYFPPEPMAGSMSFPDLLHKVATLYADEPEHLIDLARQTIENFQKAMQPRPGDITRKIHDQALQNFVSEADTLSGGFGNAQKHPRWMPLLVLWRAYLETGNEQFREVVMVSLKHMIDGALYDHIGGGFFRYTVDPLWHTPHFEKMIDVNAGLLLFMTEVWRETRDPVLRDRITGTVQFLLREFRLPSGAFASSLDANSLNQAGEKEEGAFYTWTENDIRLLLGTQAKAFLKTFSFGQIDGVEDTGPDVPGILYRASPEQHEAALAVLRQARAGRTPPRRDNKILADGNGMLIHALAGAGMALGNEDWVIAARRAFDAARKALTGPDGRLRQSAVGDRAGALATTDGLAAMANAALTLFEVVGEPTYLAAARAWAETALQHHKDVLNGGFFSSAADAEAVQVRFKPVIDDQNPSANSRMITLLVRLYFLDGNPHWRKLAARSLNAVGASAAEPDIGVAGLLHADHFLKDALQVVVIGGRDEAGTKALLAAIMNRSLPSQVLEIVTPGHELPDGHPAQNKTQINGRATVYVCRGTFCSLPVTSNDALDETLVSMRKQP